MARKYDRGYSFRSSDFNGTARHGHSRTAAVAVPSGPTEGQRECVRGDWCSARTRDSDGEWHPALTYQAFCPADRGKIITGLEDLPDAYRRLGERIGDPERSGRAVRVTPGSRVLVSPQVDALMRTMAAVLGGWAARVRAVPQLSLAPHGHSHGSLEAVTADCDVLAKHPDPLLALQPGPVMRTWTWPPGSPMPPELDTEIGHLDAVRGGDGWVTAFTSLDGTTAGTEILDLYRRAVKLLGEAPGRPETFDGIPCRACEEMALERAEPPSDPSLPVMHSRCATCRDEMDREDFAKHADRYASWARSAGIQVCRRCSLAEPRHEECCWAHCSCREGPHPRRRAAA